MLSIILVVLVLLINRSTSTVDWFISQPPYGESIIQSWSSACSSSSGQYVFVCSTNGNVWSSNNYASTFVNTNAPLFSWMSITCSSNGTSIGLVADDGIFISNNTGASWNLVAGPPVQVSWYGISSSADFKYLAAVIGGGNANANPNAAIWVSSNYGSSWSSISKANDMYGIAVSSDGSNMVAVVMYPSIIYKSTNFGISWTLVKKTPNVMYDSVVTSVNGSYFYVGAMSSTVYAFNSTDSPMTSSLPSTMAWVLATTASGKYVYAGTGSPGGPIYLSTNYGNSWSSFTTGSFSSYIWSAIAIDQSGVNVVACVENGPIYVKSTFATTSPTTAPTTFPTIAVNSNTCSSAQSTFRFRNLYIAFLSLFVVSGIVIFIVRSRSTSIMKYSIFSIILQMAVLGIDFITDLLYLYLLLALKLLPPTKHGTSISLGVVLLICRLVHPITTTTMFLGFFGHGKTRDLYDTLLDRGNLAMYGKEYGILMIIVLLEPTSFKYFPWIATDYCLLTGGYPHPYLLRLFGYSKTSQALISTLVQMFVLLESFKNVDSYDCQLLLFITIFSSVSVLLITLFEILFQSSTSSSEKHDIKDDSKDSRITVLDECQNPISLSANRIDDIGNEKL